jgi:hypothetical protein
MAVTKPRYMLEHPMYPAVLALFLHLDLRYCSPEVAGVSSDNPSGGDNQQETRGGELERIELDPKWVSGFVDGEGCFSVAIHGNPHVRRTRGIQIVPTFQVSQHRINRWVLEELVNVFGVGRVRGKGQKSDVCVFSVYGVKNIIAHVLPFFDKYPPVVKAHDYQLFRRVVYALHSKAHLERDGFERVVRWAYAMNANGRQRRRTLEEVLWGSSETVREARATDVAA